VKKKGKGRSSATEGKSFLFSGILEEKKKGKRFFFPERRSFYIFWTIGVGQKEGKKEGDASFSCAEIFGKEKSAFRSLLNREKGEGRKALLP